MRQLKISVGGCVVNLVTLLVLLACPGQYAAQAERNEAYQEKSTAPFSKQVAKGFLQRYDQRLRQRLAAESGSFQQPDDQHLTQFLDALKSAKENVEAKVHDTKTAGGPGIVISGSGRDVYARAVLLVKFIRRELNCDLPIEVAYIPDYSTSTFMEQALKSGARSQGKKFMADLLSVAIEDKGDQVEDNLRVYNLKTADSPLASRLDRYDFKGMHRILSIQQSHFDQVVYMDVESLPLTAPSEMLAWADLKRSGSMFWPDLHSSGDSEAPREGMWEAAGLQSPWLNQTLWRTTDPGQILIDKTRHGDVIDWVEELAGMDKTIYKALGDDSGLWEIAFALAGKLGEFSKLSHWPRIAMSEKTKEVYEMQAIVQNSPLGVPVFLRRTNKMGYNSFKTAVPPIVWLTIPLANSGRNAFAVQEDTRQFGIHDQSTIYPDDADCSSVDVATALLFAQGDPKRWDSCSSSVQSLTRKLPVALLPFSWYPGNITNPIKRVEKAVAMMGKLLQSAKLPRSGVPNSQYNRTGVNNTANFLQDQPEYRIGKEGDGVRDEKLTKAVADLYAENNWLGDGGRAAAQESVRTPVPENQMTEKPEVHSGSLVDSSVRNDSPPDFEGDEEDDDSDSGSQKGDSGLFMVSRSQHLENPDSETGPDPEPALRDRQSSQKDPGKKAVRRKRALTEGHTLRDSRRAKFNFRKRNARSRRLGNNT